MRRPRFSTKRKADVVKNALGWIRNHERSLADRLIRWDGDGSLNNADLWKEVGALVALRGLFARKEL